MTFKVCNQQCDECLFSPNKIVSKTRMAAILKDCRLKDTHFICHKASIAGQDVCCKGFYDRQTSNLMRIADRLKMTEMVAVPSTTGTTPMTDNPTPAPVQPGLVEPETQSMSDNAGSHGQPLHKSVQQQSEQDADRYRWLRGQFWNDSSLFVVAGSKAVVRLGTDCPNLERLDAAIDAAMKGAP